MSSTVRLALLCLACLAQLGAVATSVVRYELTLARGEPYRLALAPVDPEDPYRGRYVALRFEAELTDARPPSGIDYGDPAYAVLEAGRDGFARIRELRASPPREGDYLRVIVDTTGYRGTSVTFPFNRFFAEESLAPRVEAAYGRNPTREQNYAIVRVRDGRGVIERLVVSGQDASEW
ncbi:MAG: GDYXXLXY domain-containing protein [Polyangiaceae bacterium]|nr:GDYXXLXY domain-containing protein [Polyangiaceae bacterium]